MARFTPEGWKCSPQAAALYLQRRAEVDGIVASAARTYFNLPAIDKGDLQQEGLTAALYALDSFSPERGSLMGYLNRVVRNALAMVACEATAQCRQPYTWVKEEDAREYQKCAPGEETPGAPAGWREVVVPGGWRRVVLSEGAEPDAVRCEMAGPGRGMEAREDALAELQSTARARARLADFRAQLSPAAQRVLDVRLDPPMELLVLARNLIGRNVSEEAKMPTAALATFLGMTSGTVQKALKEIRDTYSPARSAAEVAP